MQRIAILVFALAALVPVLGSGGFAAPSPADAAAIAPPQTESAALVVMTFNIRYGTAADGDNAWPARRKLVIDRIRESHADVIGLQEALRFQIDELLTEMPEYRSVGVGRDDGQSRGEHSAILYRHDRLHIRNAPAGTEGERAASSGDFWYSATPHTPGSKSWGNTITRICSWVRLYDSANNTGFTVFNTHLDHESQPSREKSVELLKRRIAELAADDAVIVTGDFNAGESNAAIRAMLQPEVPSDPAVAARAPLRDTFRAVHPQDAEVGTFNGFKGKPKPDSDKIDYIFVNDRWDILAASIDRTMPDGRFPSDHFPVLATIRPKPVAQNPESPTTPPATNSAP